MAKTAGERAGGSFVRDFALGGFFRIGIFGPGFPDSRVSEIEKHKKTKKQKKKRPLILTKFLYII